MYVCNPWISAHAKCLMRNIQMTSRWHMVSIYFISKVNKGWFFFLYICVKWHTLPNWFRPWHQTTNLTAPAGAQRNQSYAFFHLHSELKMQLSDLCNSGTNIPRDLKDFIWFAVSWEQMESAAQWNSRAPMVVTLWKCFFFFQMCQNFPKPVRISKQ